MHYARGDWQRPSWQGRNISSTVPDSADDLYVACLLVERSNGEASEFNSSAPKAEDSDQGEFKTKENATVK